MPKSVRLLALVSFLFSLAVTFSPSIVRSQDPDVTPEPPDSSKTITITAENRVSTQSFVRFTIQTNYDMDRGNPPKITIFQERSCLDFEEPYVSDKRISVQEPSNFFPTSERLAFYSWQNPPENTSYSAKVVDQEYDGVDQCFPQGRTGTLTSATLTIGDSPPTTVIFGLVAPGINWDNPPTLKIWEGPGCSGTPMKQAEFNETNSTAGRYLWSIGNFRGPYSAKAFVPGGSSTSCMDENDTPGSGVVAPGPQSAYCLDLVGIEPDNPTARAPIYFTFRPDDTLDISNYQLAVAETGRAVSDLTVEDGNWVGILNLPQEQWLIRLYVSDGECTVTTINVGPYDPNAPEAATTQFLSENTKKIINTVVSFAFGIAGGVAFLLLIYGGFKFIFSVGNPDSIQQGREIITAAIIGLIVVVFSVFLLRLIGISILGLPI